MVSPPTLHILFFAATVKEFRRIQFFQKPYISPGEDILESPYPTPQVTDEESKAQSEQVMYSGQLTTCFQGKIQKQSIQIQTILPQLKVLKVKPILSSFAQGIQHQP